MQTPASMRRGAGARLSAPSTRSLRPVGLWVLVLAAGVLLLYLRYDFGGPEDGRFAERGFALSAYLFLVALPVLFFVARRVLCSTAVAGGLTGVVFVALTVPYELLGLDGSYYYATRPHWFPIDAVRTPSLEFFPDGTLRAFPYDYLFVPALFALGAGIIWGVWWLRRRAGATAATRSLPLLLTGVFAAICLMAWLHSGMRGPYTYLAYFQAPEAQQHWYHVFHFQDGSGASEADQFAFSPLEDIFQGAPRDGDNELVRRPFSFYMASQVSYFVNTFYVWLGLNCLFWLAAVVATARWVTVVATPRAGLIAGGLALFGPGFVAFASTPAMYMQYYAAVALGLLAFEELVVRRAPRRLGDYALFAGAFALCALTYDLTPMFVALLGYGLARRVPWRPLVASLAGAWLLSRGFTWVVTGVLGIDIVPTNAHQLEIAVDATKDLLTHPSLPAWYDAIVDTVPKTFEMLLQAFFVVPLVVALFGIPKLKDRALRWLCALLVLGVYATVAVLQIGDQLIGTVPRLVYPAFPAIYLLAALALDGIRLPRLRIAAPIALLGLMFVLVNVDLFGYPTQYVEFFVSDPPKFLPR